MWILWLVILWLVMLCAFFWGGYVIGRVVERRQLHNPIVQYSSEDYFLSYLRESPIDCGDPPIVFGADFTSLTVDTPDGIEHYRLVLSHFDRIRCL